MIIVLDSNEYIDYLGRKLLFLDRIFTSNKIIIYVNETITKEVLRNIDETIKKEFFSILFKDNIIPNNEKLPLILFEKYRKLGLKKGDIAIAAFCENIKADCLITENRHFLRQIKFDKFQVLSLKEFLVKERL